MPWGSFAVRWRRTLARGLSKIRCVGKFIANGQAEVVDGAVLLASDLAKHDPGGVFDEHGVEAVEAIVIANITLDLGRVGMLRRGDGADI